MKLLQKFLLVAVSLGIVAGAWAADIQKYLTEGQTAYLRGDLVTAKKNFEIANKVDPKNPTVIGYLRQIAAAEAKNPVSASSESEYKDIIIPQLQFKEATLNSALEFMKKKVSDASGGKKSVNFVMQLSAEAQNTPITLSLSNIPFTEALRYVAELVGAKVEYQKFAVVIKPATGASAPVASGTKPGGDAPTPQ
ncbi:MAG TPA: hypothetical protein VFG14_11995 [Chthoniobacteraceae bacterium]|nr:hypothetical protein [Chthoniobacteraceae bacterium]